MKLVIATPLYPPEIGGPATYAKEVEAELPARGWETVVVPFSHARGYPKVFRHIVYGLQVFSAARRADAVFAQDTVSCGFPALIAARLARVPFIVRVPGDYAWEQGSQRFGITDGIDAFQKKSYGGAVGLMQMLQRRVVRGANRVVVPSEYFGSIVAGWGVSPQALRVIYNGLHLPLQAEAPYGILPHPFILSAGRLVPWKGFAGLIALMKELPEWRLVIAGDGPQREQLESRAREAGVFERVLFLGRVPRAAWIGWCEAADAFVLNTSFESFSFQIVEAMASGAPVIATKAGSIPEIVADGKEGVLVEPDDLPALARAIRSTASEQGIWKERAAAAKHKAATFSVARTSDALAALLKEVCAASV